MANYNVKFACGHEEAIQLFGKVSARYEKINYYEKNGQCSNCYKAEQAAKKAAEGFEIIEVKYAEYKKNYADCKVVADSYNAKEKSIKIYVPKAVEEVKENPYGLPVDSHFMIEEANNIDEFVTFFMSDINPDDIVANAGIFDDENLVIWLYEKILETRNVRAIITNDGAIVFDETLIYQVENEWRN